MKIISKVVGLGMVCLMLGGCGKSDEEKVLSQAYEGGEMKQSMPDCAQRDVKTRLYLNGRGCTKAEREVWRKQNGL